MAFKLNALTRSTLAGYGLTEQQIAYAESVEEVARATVRALRVPSEVTLLRRRAKLLEREARRRRMHP